MKELLTSLVSKLRYGKKLDVQGSVCVFIVSLVMGFVGVYVYCSGRGGIFDGTIVDSLLVLEIVIFYLNTIYIAYELGVKLNK